MDFIYSECRMHIYLKFESYTLQSKNLAHKSVDIYVQNALKTRLRASLIQFFRGSYPLTLVRGRKGEEKKEEGSREEGEEGKGCVMAVGGWMPLPLKEPIPRTDFDETWQG